MHAIASAREGKSIVYHGGKQRVYASEESKGKLNNCEALRAKEKAYAKAPNRLHIASGLFFERRRYCKPQTAPRSLLFLFGRTVQSHYLVVAVDNGAENGGKKQSVEGEVPSRMSVGFARAHWWETRVVLGQQSTARGLSWGLVGQFGNNAL